jgi:ribosome-associated translation inhibitor RaiA
MFEVLEGIKLRFFRFEPEEHFREKVRRVLSNIFMSSPSDASLTAAITKISRNYLVQLNICSQNGVFSVESIGSTAEKALQLAEQKIKRQLSQWRRTRTLDNPSRLLFPA